jgi:hypothetical protein
MTPYSFFKAANAVQAFKSFKAFKPSPLVLPRARGGGGRRGLSDWNFLNVLNACEAHFR